MNTGYDFFLYGRIKGSDYGWLVEPQRILDESFFAKTTENHNRDLVTGNLLFHYENVKEFGLFCVFFLSSFKDERGRAIFFSAGITFDKLKFREFNCRLPSLISEAERFIELSMKPYHEAILSTNKKLFRNRNVDISSFIPYTTSKLESDFNVENSLVANKEETLREINSVDAKFVQSIKNTLTANPKEISFGDMESSQVVDKGIQLEFKNKPKITIESNDKAFPFIKCRNFNELYQAAQDLLVSENTPDLVSNFYKRPKKKIHFPFDGINLFSFR